MLEPKTIELKRQDGETRTFILHKVPAIPMRKIVAHYPVSNLPKLGDYAASEAIMLELIGNVIAVTPEGTQVPLVNRAAIDNHVKDWETLAKLEWAMLEYNVSFFANVKNSSSWTASLETWLPKILSTLTASLQASSQTEKQPS